MTRAQATQATISRAMTEDQLLYAVLELSRMLGLRTAHFRSAWTERGYRTPVAGDGAGWPDLIIVGQRLIIRELKSERGRVDPEQTAWLALLGRAGVDAAVWRPAQWIDGTIREELMALRWVTPPIPSNDVPRPDRG